MEPARTLHGGVAEKVSPAIPAIIRSPDWKRQGVVAAFATRRNPLGREPAGDCNISLSVGRNPDEVLANRAVLARRVGLEGKQLATVRQCHWAGVVEVTAPSTSSNAGPLGQAPGSGMVTADRGVALLIGTADCLPVLLADFDGRCVAALHIGWRELAAGVIEDGVAALRALGGHPHRISAWLGPCICSRCYAVSEDVRTSVGRRYPLGVSTSAAGAPAIDLAAGAREALSSAGVDSVSAVDCCTFEHPLHLYSHRRDGRTGIQGSFIALK